LNLSRLFCEFLRAKTSAVNSFYVYRTQTPHALKIRLLRIKQSKRCLLIFNILCLFLSQVLSVTRVYIHPYKIHIYLTLANTNESKNFMCFIKKMLYCLQLCKTKSWNSRFFCISLDFQRIFRPEIHILKQYRKFLLIWFSRVNFWLKKKKKATLAWIANVSQLCDTSIYLHFSLSFSHPAHTFDAYGNVVGAVYRIKIWLNKILQSASSPCFYTKNILWTYKKETINIKIFLNISKVKTVGITKKFIINLDKILLLLFLSVYFIKLYYIYKIHFSIYFLIKLQINIWYFKFKNIFLT